LNFESEVMSPSSTALKSLYRKGYRTPTASGSEYWMIDDERLDERRQRIDAERFD